MLNWNSSVPAHNEGGTLSAEMPTPGMTFTSTVLSTGQKDSGVNVTSYVPVDPAVGSNNPLGSMQPPQSATDHVPGMSASI